MELKLSGEYKLNLGKKIKKWRRNFYFILRVTNNKPNIPTPINAIVDNSGVGGTGVCGIDGPPSSWIIPLARPSSSPTPPSVNVIVILLPSIMAGMVYH